MPRKRYRPKDIISKLREALCVNVSESIRTPLAALRPIRLIETHSSRNDDNLFCHLLNR